MRQVDSDTLSKRLRRTVEVQFLVVDYKFVYYNIIGICTVPSTPHLRMMSSISITKTTYATFESAENYNH